MNHASHAHSIFLIHGRNLRARNEVRRFVQALGLTVRDFEEVQGELGAAAFLGDIVKRGIETAHGVIAVFTADEYAALLPAFRDQNDAAADKFRMQPRANVIFEAGIALAIAEQRTILVLLGREVTLFSDLAGRHHVRLGNDVHSRGILRNKLIDIGCNVNLRMNHWTDPAQSGDFEQCLLRTSVQTADPFAEIEPVSYQVHNEDDIDPSAESSPGDTPYSVFFKDLISELLKAGVITRAPTPNSRNWQSFPSGVREFYYSVSFPMGNWVRTELYIENNKSAFNKLRAMQAKFTDKFEDELHWEALDGRKASRIAVYKSGSVNDGAERLSQYRRWVIRNLKLFRQVFGPELPKL